MKCRLSSGNYVEITDPRALSFLRLISVNSSTGEIPRWDAVPRSLGGEYLQTILDEMRLVQRGPWHDETVMEHTRLVCKHLGAGASPVEACLGVLHDSAKAECEQIDPDGGQHFPEHASRGMARAIVLLTRLRFPREVVEEVANHIANHMLAHWSYNSGDEKWLIPLLHLSPEGFETFLRFHEADLLGRRQRLMGIPARLAALRENYRVARRYQYVPTPIEVYEKFLVHITKEQYGKLLDAIVSGKIHDRATFERWGVCNLSSETPCDEAA